MIHFLIGGAKKSGAEKRMLRTAIEVSRLESVSITMRSSLKKALFNELDKSSNVEIKTLKDELYGRRSNVVFILSLILFNLKYLIVSKQTFHIALFKPICFPTIFYRHRCLYEVTSPDVAVSSYVEKMVHRHTKTSLIAVSPSVNRILTQRYPEQDILVRQVPFLDTSELVPSTEKENVVIFAHRLIERKNPILCVKSFLEVSERFPNWQFLICGDGPLEAKIASYCSNSPNVNFMGKVDDLRARLQTSKIFVSLIEPDNYPSQSVLEAIARANALVVSNTGDSVSMFLHDNGIAVELDQKEIVNALANLIASDDSQQLQRQQASVELSERYNLTNYIKDSVSFYHA